MAGNVTNLSTQRLSDLLHNKVHTGKIILSTSASWLLCDNYFHANNTIVSMVTEQSDLLGNNCHHSNSMRAVTITWKQFILATRPASCLVSTTGGILGVGCLGVTIIEQLIQCLSDSALHILQVNTTMSRPFYYIQQDAEFYRSLHPAVLQLSQCCVCTRQTLLQQWCY